jgi:molybdenum cofactor cytidylyltransferase
MTFALVPAAGHSTRMGRPKLTLPLGDRTVIEHVVAALRAGGVEHVVVVVGPHVADLEPLATAAGADVLSLAEPTPDMRATVEHGLRWIEDRLHSGPNDPWLLVPADHPVLSPGVVRQVVAAGSAERPIVVPMHAGRRGHPTRFAWRHAAAIRALPPDQGINALLRGSAEEVHELPVADPTVLCDLDTPDDYQRLLAGRFHHSLTNVPS